jgi:hypothetical protein
MSPRCYYLYYTIRAPHFSSYYNMLTLWGMYDFECTSKPSKQHLGYPFLYSHKCQFDLFKYVTATTVFPGFLESGPNEVDYGLVISSATINLVEIIVIGSESTRTENNDQLLGEVSMPF